MKDLIKIIIILVILLGGSIIFERQGLRGFAITFMAIFFAYILLFNNK